MFASVQWDWILGPQLWQFPGSGLQGTQAHWGYCNHAGESSRFLSLTLPDMPPVRRERTNSYRHIHSFMPKLHNAVRVLEHSPNNILCPTDVFTARKESKQPHNISLQRSPPMYLTVRVHKFLFPYWILRNSMIVMRKNNQKKGW